MQPKMQEIEKQVGNFGELLNSERKYLLKLYITGSAPRSISAINNITAICKNNLVDYELQIIDIYVDPSLAKEARIIAAPTLIRVLPYPQRRIIGDLAGTERVLTCLED
jgi:circadian clock protein KaiB